MVFILLFNTYAFADSLELDAQGAILVDYDSGRVLYEKNAHKKMYPASTTKILTAILAIEYGKMDEMVLIDDEIVSLTSGSHIALDREEEVRFEDLLNALLIASANDSALALGKHIAGDLDAFVQMMNDKAKEIGADNTNFANPHGLHDDNHYTTAYDLYLIAAYAMENPLFREIVNKTSYTIPPTNQKDEERIMHTTNKFLRGRGKVYVNGKLLPIKYDGISGVKTGYTNDAGSCLVSFANKNGRNIYSVVLKSQGLEVYADTIKLMDHGFKDFTTAIIGNANEFIDNIDVENGSLPYVSAILDQDIYYTLSKDEPVNLDKKVKLDDEIIAPISKGDRLGTVEYYLDGDLVAEGNMVSTLSVDLLPTAKLKDIILSKWYLFILAFWFIYRLIILYNKRFRKTRRRKSFYGYDSIK